MLCCTMPQVDYADFGHRLTKWRQHGFPDLEDDGGYGVGTTTMNVLIHPTFGTNPHGVSHLLFFCVDILLQSSTIKCKL